MISIVGDIWEQRGYVVVSTNLGGIHGRGLAKQAKDKGYINITNRDFDSRPHNRVLTIAVKGWAPETRRVPGRAFSESVTGRNIDLLKSELDKLVAFARTTHHNIYLPFIGLGFGEGDASVILPMLEHVAKEPNIILIAKDADTVKRYPASFRPGVRRDSTTR